MLALFFKEIVNQKNEKLPHLITLPHVVLNHKEFVSSVEHKGYILKIAGTN